MNNNTMGKKFKDVVKMVLFGRNDKLITDTSSIYSGYDRNIQTLVGGGINSATVTSYGQLCLMLLQIFILLIHQIDLILL